IGAARALSRGGRRAGWGRQAWQLGALIALPCVALETLVALLHSRDFLGAIAELHDPVAGQLRVQATLHDRLLLGVGTLAFVYLAGTARYLSSERVVRYCVDEDATSRTSRPDA